MAEQQEHPASIENAPDDKEWPEATPSLASGATQGDQSMTSEDADEPQNRHRHDAPPNELEEIVGETGETVQGEALKPARPDHCAAGLFGKLPARGDFISRAIPRTMLRPLEDWLISTLREAQSLIGKDWDAAWYSAPAWRFWLGSNVLGGNWQRGFAENSRAKPGAVTGVLLPSTDRNGRHFPLLIVLADELAALMPPPVVYPPDEEWYACCDQLLYDARQASELEPVEEALARLPGPLLPEWAADRAAMLQLRSLWGQGEDLWNDIAGIDHHMASQDRSYWWAWTPGPHGHQTSALALPGLPDATTFAFMLEVATKREGGR